MANADLTLRLLLKDEASSKLDSFGKQVKQALAIGAVTAFGVASVKAFAEAEAAQARLGFAFQKFPAMQSVALGALREYNKELAAKTAVDDDAIASGQAVLAQFKLTGEQVRDVTPLLLDYAAATGRAVPEAASVLGKALLGNARALKEIGISYTATGDTAADFAAITDLLSQKVGGFAETFAQTAAGQLQEFNRQIGEIQEIVGAALVPALSAANAALGPLLGAVSKMDGPMLAASAALAAMALNIQKVGPAVGSTMASMSAFSASVTQSSKVTATGFAAIGQSAVSNMKGLSAVAKVGGGALAGLRSAASGLLGVMGGPWGAAMLGAGVVVGGLISQLMEARAQSDALRGSLDAQTAATTEMTAQLVYERAARESILDMADREGIARSRVIAAVMGQQDAYDELSQGHAMLSAFVVNMRNEVQREQSALQASTAAVREASGAVGLYGDATQEAAQSTQGATRAIGPLGDALADVKSAAGGLAGALGRIDAVLARREAVRGYQAALKEFIEKPSRDTGEAVVRAMTNAANAFDKPRAKAKFVKDAVNAIRAAVDSSGLPGRIQSQVTSPLSGAETEARGLLSALNSIPGTYTAIVTIQERLEKFFSAGGYVSGPGGPTDDAVPAMLSNGEWVMNADAVRKYGPAFMQAVNSGTLGRYRRGGQAARRGGGLGRTPGQSVDDASSWVESSQQDRRSWWRDQMQGLRDAADEAQGIAQAAFDALQSFREGFRAQASVTTHVFGDTEGAQSAVFDARRAYNQALGTEREAEALERLNEAKKAAADAQATRTPQAVLATVNRKLATMRQFVGDLATMRQKGFPEAIIRDVLGQGIESGAEMARVLATADAATVAGFQAAQIGIDAATSDLAGFTPLQANYDTAMANLGTANAALDRYAGGTINTTIVIDGRAIVQALQDYRRSTGGYPLGLG